MERKTKMIKYKLERRRNKKENKKHKKEKKN